MGTCFFCQTSPLNARQVIVDVEVEHGEAVELDFKFMTKQLKIGFVTTVTSPAVKIWIMRTIENHAAFASVFEETPEHLLCGLCPQLGRRRMGCREGRGIHE